MIGASALFSSVPPFDGGTDATSTGSRAPDSAAADAFAALLDGLDLTDLQATLGTPISTAGSLPDSIGPAAAALPAGTAMPTGAPTQSGVTLSALTMLPTPPVLAVEQSIATPPVSLWPAASSGARPARDTRSDKSKVTDPPATVDDQTDDELPADLGWFLSMPVPVAPTDPPVRTLPNTSSSSTTAIADDQTRDNRPVASSDQSLFAAGRERAMRTAYAAVATDAGPAADDIPQSSQTAAGVAARAAADSAAPATSEDSKLFQAIAGSTTPAADPAEKGDETQASRAEAARDQLTALLRSAGGPPQTADASKTSTPAALDNLAPVDPKDAGNQAAPVAADSLRTVIQDASTSTSSTSRVSPADAAPRTVASINAERAAADLPPSGQGSNEAGSRPAAAEASAIVEAPSAARTLPAAQVVNSVPDRDSVPPAATPAAVRAQEIEALMSQQPGQSGDGSRDEAARREASSTRLMAGVQVQTSGAAATGPAVLAPSAVGQPSRPVDEDVARQIVQAVHMQWRNGVGDARLTLQPEYLGEVVISLRVDGGAVTATVHAAEPEVRAWLQAHEPLLKQGLANQGLVLDQLSVRDENEGRGNGRDGGQPQEQPQPQPQYRPSTTELAFSSQLSAFSSEP